MLVWETKGRSMGDSIDWWLTDKNYAFYSYRIEITLDIENRHYLRSVLVGDLGFNGGMLLRWFTVSLMNLNELDVESVDLAVLVYSYH